MGTAAQFVWSASSGLLRVTRDTETTAKAFTPVETTGGSISYPFSEVPSEETEWVSLLTAERESLARRGVKPKTVNKAIKELRYRR